MTVAETVTGRGTQTAPELIPLLDQAAEAATKLRDRAVAAVAAKVASGGKIDGAALEREQHAAHGLAWIATYVEALRQLASYARRLDGEGRFGEMESLLAQIAAGRISRPAFRRRDDEPRRNGAPARAGRQRGGRGCLPHPCGPVADPRRHARGPRPRGHADQGRARARRPSAIPASTRRLPPSATRCAASRKTEVEPHAQDWHLKDEYVPLELIAQMSELGVFSLTLPEEYGGLGLGKEAMCVVSEELSRGYIGVGSLGTRSEIAEELILNGGTDAQKQEWLPKIASGEVSADRGVHRAQYRLRPRLAHHPGGQGRRRLSHHRPEDLDHPRRARRPDDRAGPHRPQREGLSRVCRCSWRRSRAAPTIIRFRPTA